MKNITRVINTWFWELHQNIFFIYVFSSLLVTGCDLNPSKQISEILDVYEYQSGYFVKGRLSDHEYFNSKDASIAIQFAINQLDSLGGEIYLHPGKYYLSSQINVPSYINLSGSASLSRLILNSNHDTGIAIMAKGKNKVIIKDLWIQVADENITAKSGVVLDNCGDSKVSGITCIGGMENGIQLINNSFLCEITGCRIGGTMGSGILLNNNAGGGRAGSYLPNLINSCIIYRCEKGIEFKHTIVANVLGCIVNHSKSYAFHLHTESNSILLNGNRSYQIEDDAVMIENSHEINLTGNIFCWQDGNGIVLKNVVWGTVSGNNIIDTGNVPFVETKTEEYAYWKDKPNNIESYQKYGIKILGKSTGLSISGNAIFNWASNPPMIDGIYEEDSSNNNLIANNNINGFTGVGVRAKGQNSLSVNNLSVQVPALGNSTRFHSFDTRLMEAFINELEKSSLLSD